MVIGLEKDNRMGVEGLRHIDTNYASKFREDSKKDKTYFINHKNKKW